MLRDSYSHWIDFGQGRQGEGLDVQVTNRYGGLCLREVMDDRVRRKVGCRSGAESLLA